MMIATNKIITSLILALGLSFYSIAQDNPTTDKPSSEDVKTTQKTIGDLYNYYQQYEKTTTDGQKKNAFDEFVKNVDSDGSEKEKNDAFKIVDAYIKADTRGENQSDNSEGNGNSDNGTDLGIDQEEIENIAEDAQQQAEQGQQAVEDAVNNLKEMSYTEFESYMMSINPLLCKKDIQQTYNEMHQNDGREVTVDEDCEETKAQKQIKALNILQNPQNHTYLEFRGAILYFSPNTPESEIKEAWNKSKSK